jgi:hypothetical protein
MCSVRRLLSALGVGVVLALGGCTSQGLAIGTANSTGVSVEAVPNSVQPGSTVTIRANCGDSSANATVSSRVFRTVNMSPSNGTLQAQATINTNTRPGSFQVNLRCTNGSASSATASTTITVVNQSMSASPSPSASQTVGPHTGGGFLANHPGQSGAQQSRQSQVWLVGGLAAIFGATAVALASMRRRKVAIRLRRRR